MKGVSGSTKKLTKEEFERRGNLIHGNIYDYSNVVYVNTKTPVEIICSEHGPFKQIPGDHIGKLKCGCSKCGNAKNGKARRLTREEVIAKSNEMHKGKYNYSKVIYTLSNVEIEIICPEHGSFWQLPSVHMAGNGCRKCANDIVSSKLSSNADEFISKAKPLHNNKYDYSKVVYVGSKEPVIIICPDHGEFSQMPNNHLSGEGCRECSIIENGKNRVANHAAMFIIKANVIHGNIYDYSQFKYQGAKVDGTIICKTHGTFQKNPNEHLNGVGCKDCAMENKSAKRRAKESAAFLERCIEIHEGAYDYTLFIYNGTEAKSTIICKEHGEFSKSAHAHLSGQGCQKCARKYGKQENEWLDYIWFSKNEEDRQVVMKFGSRWIKVDGFDPSTNTIYEYYGDFWHGHPTRYNPNDINGCNYKTYGELYNNTMEREAIIKSAGYNLVSIWESDWLKIKPKKPRKRKNETSRNPIVVGAD